MDYFSWFEENHKVENFEDFLVLLLNKQIKWIKKRKKLFLTFNNDNFLIDLSVDINENSLFINDEPFIGTNNKTNIIIFKTILKKYGGFLKKWKPILEEINQINLDKYQKEILIINEAYNVKNNELKLKILKSRKNEREYIDDSPFSPLLDLFSSEKEKINIKKPIKIDNFEINILEKKEKNKKKKTKSDFDTLILWDIENINFFNDFSVMSRNFNIPKSKKIVFLNKKRYSNDDFELIKLKKRHWEIKKTKKDADSLLIRNFNKYKTSIKKLILISDDQDFKEIISDAITLNINVEIIYRDKNIKWFKDIKCKKINIMSIIQSN